MTRLLFYGLTPSTAFNNPNVLWKWLAFNLEPDTPALIRESGFIADGFLFSGNFIETHYLYDFYSQRIAEGHDSPDGTNNWCESNQRVSTYTNYYKLDGGQWFQVNEQWTYPINLDPTPTLVERVSEKLTGFASTDVSETQRFDADTNQTTIKVTVDLPNKKVTTTTTVPQSPTLSAVQVVVNGLLQTETTPTVAQPTTHCYDALGREVGQVDPLGNLNGTRYDPSTGQVTATTNAQLEVTSMAYYPAGGTNAGLLNYVAGPTGKKTYYNYNGVGHILQIWGDVPYPEKREYNSYGDQITLTTYRGGSQWTGSSWPANTGPSADVTTWNFDEATGLLLSKVDAAGKPVSFDYYDNHYLKTRTWARGAVCTNLYTDNGDLVGLAYSDGTSVLFTNENALYLNRQGKPAVILDASGASTIKYDFAGRVVSTTCTNGLMTGITVTNHFNPVYGRDFLKVSGTTTPLTNQFGYDSYGRLGTVSCGIYSAAYGYLPNSDLLLTTTCKSNTLAILTTTRTWETGPRLKGILNTANGATVTSHTYQYDSLARRKQAALEDGSAWLYDYDDRNQLTGARRYWYDWTPVAGQQFSYNYDNIGNRSSASSGGDVNGANVRPVTYAINSLNEYTNITNLGYRDILGVAFATNTVGVTNTITGVGGLADRKIDYFHREVSVSNTNSPLWQTVNIGSGGCVSNGGFAFPAYTQTNTYDFDGNLTSDSIWTYEWDAENRLKGMSMTNIAGLNVPSMYSKRLRLDFAYDYAGRRVQKSVAAWNGSTFTNASTFRFVYNGWNLVAVLNPQYSIQQAFLWGQDLSGTLDGAGGIGGMIAFLEASNGQISNCHFACYDANGNVTGLAKSSDVSVSGRYDYSAYGEVMRATGLASGLNPFRFSTKYCDLESGMLNYGFRYYYPSLGRWTSRDPSGENGGLNLFGFCGNSPLVSCDRDGKDYYVITEEGASGVHHRVVIGDDGSGNSYSFEMYPNAKKWWQFYRRFSGTGVMQSKPLKGSPRNYISGEGIIGVEYMVKTGKDEDERLSEAAQRLDNTGFWYFLGV